MTINKDTIKGAAKEISGKVKQEWGKATNNPSTVAAGNAKEAEGKMQGAYGRVKEEAKEDIIGGIEKVKKAITPNDRP